MSSNLLDFWRLDEIFVNSLLNLTQEYPADEIILTSQLWHPDHTNNQLSATDKNIN